MPEEVDSHQCLTADAVAIHVPNLDPPAQLADSPLLVQKTSQLERKLGYNDDTWNFVTYTIEQSYFKIQFY
jgi:hypothetical protein